MGEAAARVIGKDTELASVDTFGGRVHGEWDSQVAASPLGQLPFSFNF
jgi:hypothetical protein